MIEKLSIHIDDACSAPPRKGSALVPRSVVQNGAKIGSSGEMVREMAKEIYNGPLYKRRRSDDTLPIFICAEFKYFLRPSDGHLIFSRAEDHYGNAGRNENDVRGRSRVAGALKAVT